MSGSLRIGRVAGIDIEVHYTWLIVFGLVVIQLVAEFGELAAPASVAWPLAIVTSLTLFACVVAHELAHSLVANMSGPMVDRVTLFVFGGVAHLNREPARARVELAVAVAGPLASVALAGLFLTVADVVRVVGGPSFPLGHAVSWLGRINLILAAFNMIPAFPLDGGRVLRALIWGVSGRFDHATRIAAAVGQGFGYLFIAVGVWLVYRGLWLNGFWVIAIGWMLVNAAQASVRRLLVEAALAGVRIADIMTSPVVAADAEWTVHRLVYEILMQRRLSEVPVVHDGRPVGIVGVEDVQKVDQQYWPMMSVVQVMRELSVERLAHPQEAAASALVRVAGQTGARLYVLGPGGTLVGVVGQRDMVQAVRIGMMMPATQVRESPAGPYYYPIPPAAAPPPPPGELTGGPPPPAADPIVGPVPPGPQGDAPSPQ